MLRSMQQHGSIVMQITMHPDDSAAHSFHCNTFPINDLVHAQHVSLTIFCIPAASTQQHSGQEFIDGSLINRPALHSIQRSHNGSMAVEPQPTSQPFELTRASRTSNSRCFLQGGFATQSLQINDSSHAFNLIAELSTGVKGRRIARTLAGLACASNGLVECDGAHMRMH
jgi:hypothetical protein